MEARMPTLYHCTSSRGLRPLWTIEEMGIGVELVVMPYPPRRKAPEFLDEPTYGDFLDLADYGEATLMGALATRVRFKFARADLGLAAAGDHYGERFAEGLSRIEAQLADGR